MLGRVPLLETFGFVAMISSDAKRAAVIDVSPGRTQDRHRTPASENPATDISKAVYL
jgi:hypothetical protein